MSRKVAEFQHRTSIFEGAYRAWSHLGKLEPKDLLTRNVTDLDPLSYASEEGIRSSNEDYRYEPLPRCGRSHPFIKVVLVRWLGSEVDDDRIKIEFNTLRYWWGHRKKGQSETAVKALSRSEKLRKDVDEYTRFFFKLAHCFVVTDKEQPPKTLQLRLKQFEKETGRSLDMNTENDFTSCSNDSVPGTTSLNLKGKCVPGKLNLPEIVKNVNLKAIQMAHRVAGSLGDEPSAFCDSLTNSAYGSPQMVPVVYYSGNGNRQIAMKVDGITCAHCIKIVETVLKGCTGQKSPIDGLLDAVADQELNGILIKIDESVNAKRIAWEAARNLSLVGYKTETIQMNAASVQSTKTITEAIQDLLDAFECPSMKLILSYCVMSSILLCISIYYVTTGPR